jgi:hypothetical protein
LRLPTTTLILPDEFFADDDVIINEIEDKDVVNATDIGIDKEEEQVEAGAVPDLNTVRREVDAINKQL